MELSELKPGDEVEWDENSRGVVLFVGESRVFIRYSNGNEISLLPEFIVRKVPQPRTVWIVFKNGLYAGTWIDREDDARVFAGSQEGRTIAKFVEVLD